MGTNDTKIREIEEELKKTQYNKATEHHIGMLKAKLSRLQMEAEASRKGGGTGFSIAKSGDATVALVGFPNVGKSSLLNALTDAESEVGNFAFTTLKAIPGTMEYNGAQIQIIDLPGIIENAAAGAGRGREVISMARNADLVMIVTDQNASGLEKIIGELYRAGIVLNRQKKGISIKRTVSGGIRIHRPKDVHVDQRMITSVLKEFKIVNADVYLRENITDSDLIEHLRQNTVYLPGIVAVNKSDLPHAPDEQLNIPVGFQYLRVSASSGTGMEELKAMIFSGLRLIKIYLREKSGEVDVERPLIMPMGCVVRDVVRRINRAFLPTFRYAIVSGPSRRFHEIRVGLDYELNDSDTVTIISKS